jgi:hypothetical protein
MVNVGTMHSRMMNPDLGLPVLREGAAAARRVFGEARHGP